MYWIALLLLVLGWAAAGVLLRVDWDGLVEGLAVWLGLLAAVALGCARWWFPPFCAWAGSWRGSGSCG